MSDRLTQYFRMVSNYRRETDPIKRKIIIEQGLPNLSAGTGSARLRLSISRFIQENTNGDEGGKRAG